MKQGTSPMLYYASHPVSNIKQKIYERALRYGGGLLSLMFLEN